MKSFNSLKSASLLILLFAFVSCGGSKPMVNDVKVENSVVNGDIYVSLSADLSLGNLLLPNATIPILIPKSGKEIGQVSLVYNADGENHLSVDLNVSETANLNLNSATLPNGSMIPLIADRQIIVVPIGKGAEVYISLTSDQAAIGVAVPIRTFDALGSKVGTAALMPIFNVSGVLGAAGVFTSKDAGKNGIALIADVSSHLGGFIQSNKIEDHSYRMSQNQQFGSFNLLSKSAKVKSAPAGISKKARKRLNRELYKLHKKRKQLKLH